MGSIAATLHCGGSSSEFAREGTAAHTLGERALQYVDLGRKAEFWIGETISVDYDDKGTPRTQIFTIDQEMADYVQVYVDQVSREPGELLVEQRFDLSEVYGVKGQFGTGDAVKLDYDNKRLYVGDLKYGRGVQVYAEGNDQLYSYAAGALKQYELFGDWDTITVAIHQPRLHHYDEHTITRAELETFMEGAREKARAAVTLVNNKADAATIEAAKTAGSEQCKWCPIKGSCRTLAAWTHEQVYADFTDLESTPDKPHVATELSADLLAKLVARADIIVATTLEWRAEMKRRLESGIAVPGWKLVTGKRGPRQWSDAAEAEKTMKAARIVGDDMYSKKLLTFPAAEKAFSKKKPKVWARLAKLLTQKDGAPAVAKESDARPALVIASKGQFHDETDISDLLG